MGIWSLSGGLYGVCRLWLKRGEFVPAWQWPFRERLPRSGVELDKREMLERYLGENTICGQRVYDVDICVPVKSK